MRKRLILPIITGLLFMGSVTACQKEEGPAEKAGKEIDEAVEQAGEKMEEMGDKAKEATEK